MPEVGLPPVDYRRFLSDVASGFAALVLIVSNIIPYLDFKKWIELAPKIDILAIIITAIFVSPALGFAINGISYASLERIIEMFANMGGFHRILDKLNVINYTNISKHKDKFKEINDYFGLKYSLPVNNKRNQFKDLFKSLEEIEDKLDIEKPDIIGEGLKAVSGGYIMFRNIAYIMLSLALFLFLFFISSHHIPHFQDLLILILLILIPLLIMLIISLSKSLIIFISIMLSIVMMSCLFCLLNSLCVTQSIHIIILLLFSIFMLFLATLAKVYYHWHVFLAALHVARKRW